MTLSIQVVQIPEDATLDRREFYMQKKSFKIGRDFACDICLEDETNTLSRTHLVISYSANGSYTVIDNSTNGAELNSEKLPSKEVKLLSDGDVLSLGGYKLLVGIIGQIEQENQLQQEEVDTSKVIQFKAETDFASTAPLIANAAVEPVALVQDQGFSQEGMSLDQELMFDPFAEGPALREEHQQPDTEEPARIETFNLVNLDQPYVPAPENRDLGLRAYRENISDALERALDRFLSEIDPEELQADYDDYIPAFVSRKKQYWRIHKRQFAKKKASHEYHRVFLALFYEEIRKR
ncbi:FHA domain-containing protein [Flexibacterium corallicola]|uniref:FHA domain-containing protein n=1 Tax=Flexibacterium corallicola TaxID=3037259 RepID=UPI00286F0134|nr:FHA domain-containing protein [Pseudovibrio sp. M1P-2-3]